MQPRRPNPSIPPPPSIAFPGSLTEEEEEELLPCSLAPVTHDAMERLTGLQPVDLDLYVRAFTHTSSGNVPDYETLEFLGDSVLGMVIAKYLIDTYPDHDEGFLTVMRTKLTRSETLYSYSYKLGLQQFVFMSGKCIYRGYHQSKKILEDVFESLIGALYLDHGLLAAKEFILRVVSEFTDWTTINKNFNYKDILMRHQHQIQKPLPIYVSEKDEDTRLFHVTIDLNGFVSRGYDKTKKKAEQLAAKHMLKLMGVPIDE